MAKRRAPSWNPPANRRAGTNSASCIRRTPQWSVIFEFNDVGFVKDDEKDKLDADKLLASIKAGTEAANEERKKMGNAPLLIVGWEQPPKYNDQTHNLEWAIRATSEGRAILNYNTRLLGRKGVMEVVLICKPEEFSVNATPIPRSCSPITNFNPAKATRNTNPATKSPSTDSARSSSAAGLWRRPSWDCSGPVILFFKKAWKLVIVALVAVAAMFKKVLNKITGNRAED